MSGRYARPALLDDVAVVQSHVVGKQECRAVGELFSVATELMMTVGAAYNARYKVLRRLRSEFQGLLEVEDCQSVLRSSLAAKLVFESAKLGSPRARTDYRRS